MCDDGAHSIRYTREVENVGEWLSSYALFLAQSVTVVVAIAVVLILMVRARGQRQERSARLHVRNRGEYFRRHRETLEDATLKEGEREHNIKARLKARKAEHKSARKQKQAGERQKTLWVLDFDGDLRASRVPAFTEEITSVLMAAKSGDEVLVRLQSGGGLVHAYGLASAQLDRLREAGLKLTVSVDKVAASGGYMMACCADHLIAAPFAVIGSIGVVAQVPNLHRLLKKNDVDVEVLTAGRHKRTLTMLGENTEEGRQKFLDDLEKTHDLFKSWIAMRRPALDIEQVSEGDIWYGQQAINLALIDEVNTSEAWLQARSDQWQILEVGLKPQRSMLERFGKGAESAIERGVDSAIDRMVRLRWEKQ
ncbi:protease [Kushneria pakistanensis]|uniref:Protease n=1 Tax=Kushneria pakistanensis TaxID=1508770 RepID=A0ABQ3FDW2_9GAMM|nr:protease SohB [Kushneria pakistanensis]GHC19909.1 protease [Kushneria pakistanensis]